MVKTNKGPWNNIIFSIRRDFLFIKIGKGKNMNRLLAILFVSALIIFVACSSDDSSGTSDNGDRPTYRVGIDITFPPFEFEEDGEYKGIDIDVIRAIGEEEGFDVEIQPMEFKTIIPSLLSGQLDIGMGGMSITEERKEKVDFSEPYYDSHLTMVVAEDNDEITSPNDLEGKTVAGKKGTTGGLYAEEIAEEMNAELRLFDSSPDMFQEVANGNSDVFFEDEPVIAYGIKQNPDYGLKIVGEPLNDTKAGIAVKKGNSELMEKINSGLQKIKDNGTYDKIIETYVGN